ncbi:propanediol utilization protein [Thioclava sp. 'Guangxiensis']|uniref:propanediol utilization protein n=1 Tax=Thioclava sp. 'Guangxiensis' TaxID=3149044 RepID=UPI00387813F3
MRLTPSTRLRVAGHFGEFLQGRIGSTGPVALVSVPCPVLGVTLDVRAAPTGHVHDPQRLLPAGALAQIQRMLRRPLRGAVRLGASMVAGAGCGASTAALTALIRHMAPALPASQIMRLCWKIEGASDPLAHAYPDCHLWASRQGESLGVLPAPPPMRLIGGLWGAPEPTRPQDQHFADISDLLPSWRAACLRGDLAQVAALAAQSAARTTALRGPAADPTSGLACEVGALGYLRAHTGSARALVLPLSASRQQCDAIRDRLRAAGYGRVVEFTLGQRRGS